MWKRAAHLAVRATYGRYILASAVALGIDISLFMLLLSAGVAATLAAAGGYIAGLGVHWLISSRLVFRAQAAGGRLRHRQKALFVLSALVGLALTSLIVGICTALGLDPRLAKLAAVAVSFQATYMLRRSIVFA